MTQNQLNTQANGENPTNSNFSNDTELLEKAKENRVRGEKTVYDIEHTPFKIVPRETGFTLVLGQQILTTKIFETAEEARNHISTWEFMCELIMTMFHIAKQYDQHTEEIIKEENLKPETETYVNQKHNEYPPHNS